MEGFVRQIKEERVTVINLRNDQTMNQERSRVWGEGWTESVYVLKVEVCRPGNDIDVRVKRDSAVKHDTQTLYLWGGRSQRAVHGEGKTFDFG